jgi:ankyrin repeat protein
MQFISSMIGSDPRYMDSIDLILKAKPNLEIVQEAPPYYADKGERTALDIAVFYARTDVVNKLLSAGAKVESIGRSALNVAANSDSVSIEIASILLKAGAQVNFRDGNGDTPLINSIKRTEDHVAMSKFLIASGADLNLKDNQGNTALILTSSNYYRVETMLALLAAGADPNIQNKDGVTAIMCILNKVEIFQKFVDSGANLDLQDLNGMTVLMKNIDYLPSVNFFIKAGAHLNLRNSEGKTALGLASYTEVRNALIRAGGIE